MPIDSTSDPDTMTAEARRDEVVCILARGLVRTVRAARSRISATSPVAATSGDTCLDLCGDLPLSVAPRPAG